MPLARSTTSERARRAATRAGRPVAEGESSTPSSSGAATSSEQTTGTSGTSGTTTSARITDTSQQTETTEQTVGITDSGSTLTVREAQAPPKKAIETDNRSTASLNRKMKIKQEIIELKLKLAELRLAAMEEQEDSEDSVMGDEQEDRVSRWLRTSTGIEPPMQIRDAVQTEQEAAPVPANRQKQIEDVAATGNRPTPTQQATSVPQANSSSDLEKFTEAIVKVIKTVQVPHRYTSTELPVYSGAYQEWLTFKSAFTETAPCYSETENLSRLRRALKGRARETVESLLFTGCDPARVVTSLEMRFGRPDTIATAELERLRALPRPTDSPRELCIFASKINNIVTTLQALHRTNYVYNPEAMKITVEKLSPALRYRFFEYAATQDSEEADLLKLSRFLDREASYAGPYAQPENISARYEDSSRPTRYNRSYHVTEKTQTENKCVICKQHNHSPADCEHFKKADPNDRWKKAKQLNLCFRCLRLRTFKHRCPLKLCDTDGCSRTHHPLLHFNRKQEQVNSAWTQAPCTHTYLKIVPVTLSGPAGAIETYALLDDGSTVTLIDAETADRVGASGPPDPLNIAAIANAKIQAEESRRVTLTLRANGTDHEVQARTVRGLRLSSQRVSKEVLQYPHLRDLDNIAYDRAVPKILIGQDNWHLLLSTQTRRGKRCEPVASLTTLGWVLHGAVTRTVGKRTARVNHITEENIDEQLRQYFALESLAIQPKRPQSDPEQRALKILTENTEKTETGHYQTALLWATEDSTMPTNYDIAKKRLELIEKKIDRNPEVKQKYNEKMEALIQKKYAEPAPLANDENNRRWYLPHFGVVNPMKPEKLRIVHDAAAKTKGVSLNDRLLTGPDLIKKLPGVLMRFRQHRYGVTGDISEMFMQIKIRPEDRDSLRYLWRGDRRDGEPTEYRMTSLIFGASCSPSTAIFVKNLNAEKHREQSPRAVSAIIDNHYVDDYLDSFETEDEAIRTATRVRDIHSEAQFKMTQWTSNSPIVTQAMCEEQTALPAPSVRLTDNKQTERVLGIIWRTNSDELAFNLDLARLPSSILDQAVTPTKRQVLQIMMSLYDPLGLASPITIKAKQIMQEAWRKGTGWDEKIDDVLKTEWETWLTHLKNLATVRIPRVYAHYSEASTLELHVFTDASESAYSAALYWRVETTDKKIYVSLIMAKSKVAPLKLTSIPRLELQAAVMGARMSATVQEEHHRKPDATTYWTDSKTVLAWIRNGARAYRPFVAHRIASIEETTKVQQWRWVPTKQNVADDATREPPQDFNSTHRWFTGPGFLRTDRATWPTENSTMTNTTGEERTCNIQEGMADSTLSIPDSKRFSRWERLINSTARVLQFIQLCKKEHVFYKRTKKTDRNDPEWGKKQTQRLTRNGSNAPQRVQSKHVKLSADLLRRATELQIRQSQAEAFQSDIENLQKNRPLDRDSRPLTHVSVNNEDPEALTPNHFLLGGSGRVLVPGAFQEGDAAGRATWRTAQHLADHFWGRWMREYLPELQHRREPQGKGREVTVGDVVLIVDGTLPRNTWPRGVVTAVYPGTDNIVRVADVRTRGGVLRRPTRKLVYIPAQADVPTSEVATFLRTMTGGRMCGT